LGAVSRPKPGALSVCAGLLAYEVLDSVQFVQRKLVLYVASVERCGGLEEKDPAFFVGDGPVLDSAWDDDKFTFFELHSFVAELDPEAALYHQEHLVFVFMMMPDEFAFQLIELHQLSIEFTGDVGFPVVVDLREFLGEVDFVGHGL
jgi:hypothetical protein